MICVAHKALPAVCYCTQHGYKEAKLTNACFTSNIARKGTQYQIDES